MKLVRMRVERTPSGLFAEDFAWVGLLVNGQKIPLTLASQQFRESLSLSPGYTLSVPDLSKVQPILIGAITDLLTFYADVQLAMRQKDLHRPGDHIYVKHGKPNSWAACHFSYEHRLFGGIFCSVSRGADYS